MKINIQRQSQKKSTFKGTIPCSTTLNFGQSTPIFSKELIPNTQITIDLKNFVRTAVMSLPTFGDYKLLTHAVFVPYSSLYKPFDSFLSKTKYNVGSPYVPTQVPVLSPINLLDALQLKGGKNGVITLFKEVNGKQSLLTSTEYNKVNQVLGTSFSYLPNTSLTSFRKDFSLGIIDLDQSSISNVYIQFSEQVKYIMRILNGLGYTFGKDTYLSALPLMATAKTMFDLFSPQQSDTENKPFESTYLYRLIMSKLIGSNGYLLTTDDILELYDMLIDNTFYINDDLIALHSLNPATSQIESVTLPLQNDASVTQSQSNVSKELQTGLDNPNLLTSDRIKSIFRIGSLIKANTQIAGRLKEFLRSRFGSSVGDNHDAIVIKTLMTDIDISDIFATATTSGNTASVLGEYGGRAIGKGDGVIKFESNCFGIFMILCTIIQRRNYFCGVNPDLYHKQTNDFYNPAFDSLGYSLSSKDIFNGGRNSFNLNANPSFGYKPRYLEYKFFHPVVAGDFNRQSQRNTLDAFIGSAYPNDGASPIYSKELNKPAFRFSLYNYNNIFYEHEQGYNVGADYPYDAISDPFIIHSLLNITMHAPMLSIGDSFETNEGNPMEVEKA